MLGIVASYWHVNNNRIIIAYLEEKEEENKEMNKKWIHQLLRKIDKK